MPSFSTVFFVISLLRTNADYYRSMLIITNQWQSIPIIVDQCQIRFPWSGIDRHWEILISSTLASMPWFLIGIDRHWSALGNDSESPANGKFSLIKKPLTFLGEWQHHESMYQFPKHTIPWYGHPNSKERGSNKSKWVPHRFWRLWIPSTGNQRPKIMMVEINNCTCEIYFIFVHKDKFFGELRSCNGRNTILKGTVSKKITPMS